MNCKINLVGQPSFLIVLNVVMYFWERERDRQTDRQTERKQGKGRERGRHRIRSRLQALSCQHRARRGAQTHKLWDHDLSWSRTLNRLSHPGTPIPILQIKKSRWTGAPGWLSWLSVRLQLRSWSRGSWVWAPHQALCWQLRAWRLLWILCLLLSMPLPYLCYVSPKWINVKKIKKRRISVLQNSFLHVH